MLKDERLRPLGQAGQVVHIKDMTGDVPHFRRSDLQASPKDYYSQFVSYLQSGRCNFAELRRSSDSDLWVLIKIDVERPQRPLIAVRKQEELLILFESTDSVSPTVLIRNDFPSVPHVDLPVSKTIRFVCLYEESWHEVRMGWTPEKFTRRIGQWLSDASQGKLHRPDQPLEPFLLGGYETIVVPENFLATTAGSARVRSVFANKLTVGRGLHRLELLRWNQSIDATNPTLVVSMMSRPLEHGALRHNPASILQLHRMMEEADSGVNVTGNLLSEFRKRLRYLSALTCDVEVIILMQLRKTRNDRARVEDMEMVAFELNDKAIFSKKNEDWNTSIPGAGLKAMGAVHEFSRKLAQSMSYEDHDLDETRIVAIGAGALGSQVAQNLCREGCKRRSDNVPRRRLDSLNAAVENRTACHLPIESIETLMEGDKDVHRGHVFARAQGVPGGGDGHQGGVPGVRAAPRHRAQDALASRATGIPQEAPSPSPQA